MLDAQIAANPTDAALLISRAREFAHHEHWHLAELDLRRAEKIAGPEFVAYELGHLYFAQEEFAISKQHFQQHLQVSKQNQDQVLWYLGRISVALGNQSEALDYFHSYLLTAHAPHPGNIVKGVRTAQEAGLSKIALEMIELGIHRVGSVPQLTRLREEIRSNSDLLVAE